MVLILVSFNILVYNLIDKIDKSHVIHPSAVGKSRKEAGTLVQKTGPAKDVNHVPGNSNKSPNLEYALVNQWRSLFLHMEDILVHEGRELVSICFLYLSFQPFSSFKGMVPFAFTRLCTRFIFFGNL